DVGAFVAALEYGSGRTATLTGKPAPSFFRAALKMVGAAPGETAVVGDDLEFDVHGAQAAGLAGILVRTGKYRPEFERTGRPPDANPGATADLPRPPGLPSPRRRTVVNKPGLQGLPRSAFGAGRSLRDRRRESSKTRADTTFLGASGVTRRSSHPD